MSLWKVLSKSHIVQQEVKQTVSSASGGGFVWGKEGFKWIGAGANVSESEEDGKYERNVSDGCSIEVADKSTSDTKHTAARNASRV